MDPVDKDIMMICSLAGCSEEFAREAFSKTKDVLLAVDSILFHDQELPKPLKRKREDINEHEEYLNSMRSTMKNFDAEVEQRKNTTSNPLDCEEQDETLDHHAEMVLQNSCLQECHLPVIEEEAQIQETECPQHPECFCDSQ